MIDLVSNSCPFAESSEVESSVKRLKAFQISQHAMEAVRTCLRRPNLVYRTSASPSGIQKSETKDLLHTLGSDCNRLAGWIKIAVCALDSDSTEKLHKSQPKGSTFGGEPTEAENTGAQEISGGVQIADNPGNILPASRSTQS